MGDYSTLHVSAGIKKLSKEEKETFVEELMGRVPRTDSAYHSTSYHIYINDDWHHQTRIEISTQAKHGRGIKEFLDWLEPMIIQGMGQNEVWAISFNEYSPNPEIRSLYRTDGI